jgi:adenylosuccinate lyase
MSLNYGTYLSPFTWRYGSPEMRQVWSEINKRRLWRKLWVALAETQAKLGLVQRVRYLLADLCAPVDAGVYHSGDLHFHGELE